MTGIIVDTNDMIELREVIIRTMKNLDIYICIDDQHYNYLKRPRPVSYTHLTLPTKLEV